jgi:2-iminobutanoate/2-iminopropanoate deaminase
VLTSPPPSRRTIRKPTRAFPHLTPTAHPLQSQAISTPHAIYVSGQLPALPSGELPTGTIAHKTSLCIANLSAILKAAGSDLSKVVKMTVFLTDMDNFAEMNAEYEKHFGEVRPARSCVAVRALPKGVLIEMECVALP